MAEELELDLDGVGGGYFVPLSVLWEDLPVIAAGYFKRLRHLFVGEVEDLIQSASVALLEWQAANEGAERIRELIGLGLVHKAMVAEVRANRRTALEDEDDPLLLEWPDERKALTPKQVEMLEYVRTEMARFGHSLPTEVMLLKWGVGWTDAEIRAYFKRKRDDRKRITPELIAKLTKKAKAKIRDGLGDDAVADLRNLDRWYGDVGEGRIDS